MPERLRQEMPFVTFHLLSRAPPDTVRRKTNQSDIGRREKCIISASTTAGCLNIAHNSRDEEVARGYRSASGAFRYAAVRIASRSTDAAMLAFVRRQTSQSKHKVSTNVTWTPFKTTH